MSWINLYCPVQSWIFIRERIRFFSDDNKRRKSWQLKVGQVFGLLISYFLFNSWGRWKKIRKRDEIPFSWVFQGTMCYSWEAPHLFSNSGINFIHTSSRAASILMISVFFFLPTLIPFFFPSFFFQKSCSQTFPADSNPPSKEVYNLFHTWLQLLKRRVVFSVQLSSSPEVTFLIITNTSASEFKWDASPISLIVTWIMCDPPFSSFTVCSLHKSKTPQILIPDLPFVEIFSNV